MEPTGKPWMLYGANGYTGRRVAEESVRRGLRPVLAGRTEDRIRPIAERLASTSATRPPSPEISTASGSYF
jgi:short subunit dehydrogenase-like uncharacterized protein